MQPPATNTPSGKNYLVTGLLSILLGIFGAHRFYLGKIGTGLAQFFTLGGFGIWTFIDIVLILFGTVKDSKGQTLQKNSKSSKILYCVFGFVVLLSIIPRSSVSGSPTYEGTGGGFQHVVKFNGDLTKITTSIGPVGGALVTHTGKMRKWSETDDDITYFCMLSGEKAQEEGADRDFSVIYSKPTDSYRISMFTYSVDLTKKGASKSTASTSSGSNSWKATKRNIVGLYHSEKGMGGWGGTCELLYGGGYFLKDQMLQNGQMIGEYSLSGNEITFYQDGSVVFKAEVSETELDIGPGKCTYLKK